MHMSTRAVSVELDELHSVKLPCILHWILIILLY
ncbi:hypothetical protein [Klebsiella pneumoniae]